MIRTAAPADQAAIRRIHEVAFGSGEEADIVDQIRSTPDELLSLVAEDEGVTGHILFSRMWIEDSATRIPAVALAPVAVLPEHQRHGIGGQLIRHGLDLLKARGEAIVLVLGWPEYYPRFGFSTQLAAALQHPFSPEAYMALELRPGALANVGGRVIYPAAFGI